MMELEPMDFDYGEKIDDNTRKIIEKKYGKDMADIYSISNGFLCDKDREVEFVSIEDILKYGKNFKSNSNWARIRRSLLFIIKRWSYTWNRS